MEDNKYKNFNNIINVNISSMTMFKVILIILVFYFLYLIRDILAILFVSVILASALGPIVDWLQERKIPRSVSVIFIYLCLLIIFSSVIYLLIPPIISEINRLSLDLPYYIEKINSSLDFLKSYSSEYGVLDEVKNSISSIGGGLQGAAGSVFTTISGIFGGILSFFLIFVITFYMLLEKNAVKKIIWSVVPIKHQPYIIQLLNRMQEKIGLWLRGQLILSFIIFLLIFTALTSLHVEYALVLALFAGLTEFVPYLGPIIAAIPAIFLAFIQSPLLALFTGLLYYLIQMFENHWLVPKIMQKMVGLNPLVSIVVLLVGFKIAGVIGIILSIPVATAVSVLAKDIFTRKTFNSQGEK